MSLPSAPPVTLSARQRRVLEHLCRAAGTPQALALRARIVLAAAAGRSNRDLAQTLGVARNTVQAWRDRWVAAAEALQAAELEGRDGGGDDDRALQAVVRGVLADAPRPGGPATFTPEQLVNNRNCRGGRTTPFPPPQEGRQTDGPLSPVSMGTNGAVGG